MPSEPTLTVDEFVTKWQKVANGWPLDLSDEEILTRLLALNRERAAGQQ